MYLNREVLRSKTNHSSSFLIPYSPLRSIKERVC
jgi:hypothetical protein